MSNHFHLVIETPQPNLVFGMKWLSGVYTKPFNIRPKLCAHLFAGRYKALVVEGSGNSYLRTVCDYVHLNPVRAHLLRPDHPLESYPWSSYGLYLQPAPQRTVWLRLDRLLGEKGIPRDTDAGRQQFAALRERRRAEEASADYQQIRRDWVLGSEAFPQELLAAVSGQVGPQPLRSRAQATGQELAEQLMVPKREDGSERHDSTPWSTRRNLLADSATER
jgi:putative transposase